LEEREESSGERVLGEKLVKIGEWPRQAHSTLTRTLQLTAKETHTPSQQYPTTHNNAKIEVEVVALEEAADVGGRDQALQNKPFAHIIPLFIFLKKIGANGMNNSHLTWPWQ
jgi:hypothetical protein